VGSSGRSTRQPAARPACAPASECPDRQTPDDQALAAELVAGLGAAVSTLSALERQALAHAVVGWSSGETAQRLGIPRKRADNALQRARYKIGDWHERNAA
jgi:DNA-directed RNA polymerase specialized sigma24 family protein